MGATSVTGVGQGSVGKVGPAIKNITINDPLKEEIHGSEMATLEDLDRWSARA